MRMPSPLSLSFWTYCGTSNGLIQFSECAPIALSLFRLVDRRRSLAQSSKWVRNNNKKIIQKRQERDDHRWNWVLVTFGLRHIYAVDDNTSSHTQPMCVLIEIQSLFVRYLVGISQRDSIQHRKHRARRHHWHIINSIKLLLNRAKYSWYWDSSIINIATYHRINCPET